MRKFFSISPCSVLVSVCWDVYDILFVDYFEKRRITAIIDTLVKEEIPERNTQMMTESVLFHRSIVTKSKLDFIKNCCVTHRRYRVEDD